jgi:hypothetical protein
MRSNRQNAGAHETTTLCDRVVVRHAEHTWSTCSNYIIRVGCKTKARKNDGVQTLGTRALTVKVPEIVDACKLVVVTLVPYPVHRAPSSCALLPSISYRFLASLLVPLYEHEYFCRESLLSDNVQVC